MGRHTAVFSSHRSRTRWVTERLQPGLEGDIAAGLGKKSGKQGWLAFEDDATTHSPVLHFHYPSTLEAGTLYIRRSVKLEFGSLTDQRPVGRHRVRPWATEVLTRPLNEMGCEVVALEVERAFWEKTTILHAEHHRALGVPMPANYSRHFADVAAMANRPETERALADDALRKEVVAWKDRFFARTWARYELAKPGTFRLVPPAERVAELTRDYQAMRDMFLDEPVSFDAILETLRKLEARINPNPRINSIFREQPSSSSMEDRRGGSCRDFRLPTKGVRRLGRRPRPTFPHSVLEENLLCREAREGEAAGRATEAA
ncbi:MAG: nucleotidyl transferase AbiEii/AbiGii toxin family protein [Verrucomicrobiae bacterium]|nr:nucleotidyl transferase AbiEii/AbiGii toxin family protein [Verrucomicrobiae bacterium]